MMKRILAGIGVSFIALTGGSGCNNLFTDMSNKTSDQAIMDNATNLINAQLYTDAIAELGLMSTAGQASAQGKILFATANAGAGGLNLINLSNTLSGSGNPSTLFLTLLKAFAGNNQNSFNYQIAAEGYIMSIAPAAANRTNDENLFMVFVELAKLGTLMAFTADPLGTGTVDATFTTSCSLTQAEADQVVTALAIIMDSMTALGTNALSSSLPSNFTTCSGPLGLLCGLTTVASVAAVPDAEQIGKTLVGESALGIGLKVQPGI